MFLYKSHILSILLISLTLITVRTQDDDLFSNLIDDGINPMQNLKADFYMMDNKLQPLAPEKVDIKLYYECLCPDCRNFDTMSLRPTVEKLASYLDLHLYPYGNAQTIDKGNGVYEFVCQHGPAECYGNKLHACAIDRLNNITRAVFFNSCMMEASRNNRGSNDEAADACGKELNVDTEWIKQCAKGPRGNALLKNYGDESKKVGFKYVPYILVNGVQKDENNFMKEVCATFKTPPPECAQVL
ncbi:hypothetical protein PYW07_007131 [Mythimna separata]|uniref:Gamma-interferon-inducible lysosomal thiol reductase n=1 Tax=Mythimna separata TaxID=271217 RepID=A0AAD7Z2N1_MYTSE|nr:hypothetical protein PYW07_007131 [Mythimna separata]